MSMEGIKRVTEFTVKRSKWIRGTAGDVPNVSRLLTPSGKMCCVGFYAEACGYTEGQLLNVCYLGSLVRGDAPGPGEKGEEEDNREWHGVLRDRSRRPPIPNDHPLRDLATGSFEPIYDVNDNDELTDQEREDKLRGHFNDRGITIHFED